MPPYYYHLKFELYATPDPTAAPHARSSSSSSSKTRLDADDIWIPAPGASIFDDLPSHPARSRDRTPATQRWVDGAYDGHDDERTSYAAAAGDTRVIDCGARRGRRTHDTTEGNGEADDTAPDGIDSGEHHHRSGTTYPVRLRQAQAQRARAERSPPPRVADGIGAEKAVGDWRFGRVRIESFDRAVGEDVMAAAGRAAAAAAAQEGEGAAATPAASLGPNLGGMGLATKGRYEPLRTKNTEAGWGVVHLYREGEEASALREWVVDGGEGGEGSAGEEEGTVLCIPAVPSYMSPSDFLGFIGEKWRGEVSHYRMVMTSRVSRYMVLMKFRDCRRAREWKKEFDGKPFDSVEVS